MLNDLAKAMKALDGKKDVEASLRSRSPKPQLGRQLEVTHSFHFRGSAPSILAVALYFHLEEERFLSNEAIIEFSIL